MNFLCLIKSKILFEQEVITVFIVTAKKTSLQLRVCSKTKEVITLKACSRTGGRRGRGMDGKEEKQGFSLFKQ